MPDTLMWRGGYWPSRLTLQQTGMWWTSLSVVAVLFSSTIWKLPSSMTLLMLKSSRAILCSTSASCYLTSNPAFASMNCWKAWFVVSYVSSFAVNFYRYLLVTHETMFSTFVSADKPVLYFFIVPFTVSTYLSIGSFFSSLIDLALFCNKTLVWRAV